MIQVRDELAALLAEVEDRPCRHAVESMHGRAFFSEHEAWWVPVGENGCAGQRPFIRCDDPFRVVVAGRQSGKTHQAAEEVVRIILDRPGTESCLLMPTYKSTKGALRHVRRALKPLGNRVKWNANDKYFAFPNGAVLYIRSADDKSGVPTRGLTLDGVFWVDEASFVPRSAWNAAMNTIAAVADPKVIVTTTARGRKGSWVFELAQQSQEDESVSFFRYRTTDSPYHNPKIVATLRKMQGEKRAAEELDAIFTEDSGAPFTPEDIELAFAAMSIPYRGVQNCIGVDLGKEKTWTVVTLLNEFGEVHVLDRFQPKRSWQTAVDRIVELADMYKAIVVIDTAHGGGAGQVVHDLVRDQIGELRTFGVNTGVPGTKGQLIERLKLDFEHGRIRVEAKSAHAEDLHHELTFFPSPERKTVGIKEILVYRPPTDDEDRFDDCVISLALAKWGQENAWTDPPTVDVRPYVEAARKMAKSNRRDRRGNGRRFGMPARMAA
jgi:phage terminase large subunit-like protein